MAEQLRDAIEKKAAIRHMAEQLRDAAERKAAIERERAECSELTILRRREVQRRTGLSRTTIYERVANGTFPAPISLGARAVGWVEAEVATWIADRIAASRAVERSAS